MAQTIKIKRSTGSAAPSTLASGELAFSKGSGTFYVGDPAAANTPIAISAAIINNAGTASLNTGITAAEIQQLLDLEVGVDIDAAGTDNSTDVTLAGTPDYLTLSGQEITLNAIDLAADVSGTLPIANGGTGATTASGARTALGVDAAGTDNSTNVTLVTTSHNYLSIAAQAITLGAVSLVDDVTDTLPISSGGTGATTASGARTALGVDAAGTDNSTNVTLAGSLDYITISGQVITRNAIDLSTDVTGSLPNASVSGLGTLATLNEVNAATIADNSVGAAELNVSGNGTSGQALVSDGDGTFTWSTISVTDNDVNVANLTARLPQITESVTIGDATDVTVTTSGGLVVTGDLTVNGTTTTVSTTNTVVSDTLLELGNGTTTAANDAGIIIERGSTGDNAFFGWDESADKFTLGTTTATGASTGNLTITTGTLVADLEGNATTASALASAVNIGGVSFDGSASINLPGVNTAGNQNTSGNAATATALATGRDFSLTGDVTASAVSFDGTGNVQLSTTIGAGAVDFAMINGAAIQTSTELSSPGFADNDTTLMTAAAIEDRILSKGYTTNVGDITSVQVSSTDGSISGTGTGSTGAISFDLEVATIDGGTY